MEEMVFKPDDSGRLFYYQNIMGPCLEFGRFDESTGKKTVLQKAEGGMNYPVFSPDGNFAGYTFDGEDETYILRTDTGKLFREIPCRADDLSFTPDGKTLCFIVYAHDGKSSYLYTLALMNNG